MAETSVNTYTTFSGADIVASFNGVAVGELAGITWSVTREKAPIYTMGSPNPRAFSRGKRGIAGTLMFTVFDRPALYNMIVNSDPTKVQYYTRRHNVLPNGGGTRAIVPPDIQTAEILATMPTYSDQLPPLDISITFANEYGQAAKRSIYGVEIINEGSGASMDDIVIEETMTFVATDVSRMEAFDIAFEKSELQSLQVVTNSF